VIIMSVFSLPDLERRAAGLLPPGLQHAVERVDRQASDLLARHGVTALRWALGLVFVWFGALKVAGVSPVEDLVADTVYWLPSGFVVPAIGWWEIIIGVGLIVPVALRLTLLLFWMQMLGTMMVLVIHPGQAFVDGNPLRLTTIGEFVVKNIVLISAGLVIGSQVRRSRTSSGDAGGETRRGQG
jgi:putative oxidoreductase